MKITSRFKKKYIKNIQAHLEALKHSFEHYFPTAQGKVLDDFKWVLNMFSVNKNHPAYTQRNTRSSQRTKNRVSKPKSTGVLAAFTR